MQTQSRVLCCVAGTLWLCPLLLSASPAASAVIESSDPSSSASNSSTNSAASAGTNSPVTLPPVTVTGNLEAVREQIPTSLGVVSYTIGQNQIQAMPQGENAPFQQVLLRAPGVVNDQFGQVHVRGEHGDLSYRVNGVLLPEGLNGFGQEIDTRLINSVSLLTGALPAQYGLRTAGIADIKTKTGSQLNGGEFSLYGGSYQTFQASFELGGATNRIDYFVTGSYLQNNIGINNPTASAEPLHDMTVQDKAFGYFSYRLDDTSKLSLLLNASYADFQIPNTPNLPAMFTLANTPASLNSATDDENQNEQNYYAVLAYQKSLDNLSMQVSAFTRYGQIHFRPDAVNDLVFQGIAGEVVESSLANGLEGDGSLKLGEKHSLRGGFLATVDQAKRDTSTVVFPVDAQGDQTSNDPFSISDNTSLSAWTAGVYAQDEWHLTERLTANYGLRYDRFDGSFDHEDQISPRLNFVLEIGDRTTAHVGYARYFTPPSLQYVSTHTLQKFKDTSNSPETFQSDPPVCERAHYFDAGVSRQLSPNWQMTLDGFYKDARHLIDLGQFGNAVILAPFNYQYGYVYGAELGSTYQRGPFSAYGNFSYVQTWARQIESAQFEFPTNELTYIQDHNVQLDHQGRFTFSGGVSYTLLKNTRLYGDVLYGNGLRGGFANSEKLPAYWPVNLGVEHVFKLRSKFAGILALKLRFDCLNVFDEVYELRNGSGLGIAAPSYGARRAFYLGLTAVF